MSETVHYKGVLKPLKKKDGETLEEQCKRYLDDKELPSYYDSYQELILEEYYNELTIQGGILYEVEKKKVDPFSDVFNATKQDNGEIKFEVRYYNGGCSFDEAIEESLYRLNNRR